MLLRVAAAAILVLAAPQARARDRLVGSPDEYAAAVSEARAGDTIILRNGEWHDFQPLFTGRGTPDRPIRLTAQTRGGVILTGRSNLRLAGAYLEVSGLVFRDGASPTDAVIAFRKDSRTYAVNSRVTDVVIDHFSKADRLVEDYWVAIYGRNNRVDHSHFAGKENAGVLLAVIRPKGQGEANYARIDHNYFGPRPPLGANTGETIRIGTSEESLSDSGSIVEKNIFDRCDGEVEIVSVKSGGNILRGNLVLQSQGAFVLRHGNGNLVERNVFLGGNKPDTGGVRVINRNQVVRFNYFQDLAGESVKGALSLMNGVPNSVINRYHQVVNARVERNSFINIAAITIGAGADEERSAAPVASVLAHNLIASNEGDPVVTVGDPSGVALLDNVHSSTKGLRRAANGLWFPVARRAGTAGAPGDLTPVRRSEVGVRWYTPPLEAPARTIPVGPGDSLASAIDLSRNGDIIALSAGSHVVAAPITLTHSITIRGADQSSTRLTVTSPELFRIGAGIDLALSDLSINAGGSSNGALIRVDPTTNRNYSLSMERVTVSAKGAGTAYNVLAAAPATFASQVLISSSQFNDISGTVVAAAVEQPVGGIYPIETLTIRDSEFNRVGMVADVARRGTDESTFGPRVTISGSRISDSGRTGVSIRLLGAQWATVTANEIRNSGGIAVTHTVGEPRTRIVGNRLLNTPAPVIKEGHHQRTPQAEVHDNQVIG